MTGGNKRAFQGRVSKGDRPWTPSSQTPTRNYMGQPVLFHILFFQRFWFRIYSWRMKFISAWRPGLAQIRTR